MWGGLAGKLWWQVLCHLPHCNIWLAIKLMLSSLTDYHSQNDWNFGCGTVFKGMTFQIYECLFWDLTVFETTISQFLYIRRETQFFVGYGNYLNILCSYNISLSYMPSLYTHIYTQMVNGRAVIQTVTFDSRTWQLTSTVL